MDTRRWKWNWLIGCMAAASMAAMGCGDNEDTQEPSEEVDAGPGDGGMMADAQACPMPEDLWEDLDIETFTQLSDLEELDVAGDVMLAEPATYWELRRTSPGGTEPTIVLSAGEKCAEAADPEACSMQLEQTTVEEGFGPSCPPGDCYQYIVVNRGDTIETIASPDDLKTFLGDIDTITEAALMAHADEYTWDITDPAAGSIRQTEDGYELLVLELVEDCDPIVTDRVQITVSTGGEVEEVRRQIFSAQCGACI